MDRNSAAVAGIHTALFISSISTLVFWPLIVISIIFLGWEF